MAYTRQLYLHFTYLQRMFRGPGWRSRFSNLLRAGQSGDRIPMRKKFSASVHSVFGAHAPSSTMGIGSFPTGVKQPKRIFDHPTLSSAEVKERVELYFYFSVPSWPVMGWTLPLKFTADISFWPPPQYRPLGWEMQGSFQWSLQIINDAVHFAWPLIYSCVC